MGLHIFPVKIIQLINMIVSIIYPAVKTYNLLLHKSEKTNEENLQYIHFLTYWIIYSLYSYIEFLLLLYIINYIPFYSELKVIFFFWLHSDTFQGAGYIYFKYIDKNYAYLDKKLCSLIYDVIPKNMQSFFFFEENITKKSPSKLKNMFK
ncbi:YOP1-like protein, putative [Hepatocystis sp. ex Piliocolobus tephrosceles]|nr:YOP1-like protein, putative [Hepatocystis sp. ex Piliocolobus tephrosceles]